VLDDFSRYIIAWKLCTTMKAEGECPIKCVRAIHGGLIVIG
jgi:hypothetical protein